MTFRRVVAAAAIGVATALLGAVPAGAVTPTGFWKPVSPPALPVVWATASGLTNGKVLLAGGASVTGVHQFSEVYDPVADAWSTLFATQAKRADASAVTLTNGKVLVVGGESALHTSSAALNSAEVFDPASNTWTAAANDTGSDRANRPIVVPLRRSGWVLVAGGTDATGTPVKTADIYDPQSNSFFPANGTMGTARENAAAVLLPSGKVLIAGGTGVGETMLNSGEVFDPTTLTFTPVANTMADPRGDGPGAVLLHDGRALIAGGTITHTPVAVTTQSASFYSEATNSFSAAGSMHTSRVNFSSAPLADGRVLVAGGLVASIDGSQTVTSAAEVYDPSTDAWQQTAAMPVGVGAAATVPLPSGQVLVIGGAPDEDNIARQAELFTPYAAPGKPLAVSATPGVNSAFVTFAPPASDGGLPIANYTIVASSGQRVTTPDVRTAVTMSGLTAGRPVTFTVIANNAFGAGAVSTASNPVTPTSAVASSPPPPRLRLTVGQLKTKVKLAAFLKGFSFTVSPNRAVALQISLLAAVNKATIARAFNLTLASKRLALSGRKRAVTLKPSKSLVGRPRSATVQLVIVGIDSAGARITTTRTIHVSR